MSLNTVLIDEGQEIVITVEEYNRLQRIEQILWQVESSLPSGLESWINPDEEAMLRGE